MLHRLAASDADIEGTLSNISETIQLEDNISSGGSYLQCFRGVDRRRTLIAIGCFAVTQVIGVSFVLGYSGYFFQRENLFFQRIFLPLLTQHQSLESRFQTPSNSVWVSLRSEFSATSLPGSSATALDAVVSF